MGRPLNKKYFGNRNVGGTGTGDDYGIGGGFVDSVTIDTAGSYTSATTATFAAPSIPTGITATGTLVYEVISATISGGTGYGNTETFDLTVNTAAGTAVLNVTSDAGGAVVTVNSVTSAGTFTGISAVTSVSGGTGNDDAVPVLTYGIKDITITNQGSGYTSAPAITIGAGAGAATAVLGTDSGAPGTSGNQENAILAYAWVNAKTNGDLNNTAGGGSSVLGDIVKQVNGNVYKVQTAQGTGRCILVAAAPAEPTVLGELGQMTITATDSSGKTYYVTKLTSRTAVLEPYGAAGHEWPLVDGLAQRVRWSFDAAVAIGSTNSKVQIANA
jgi:hypothetical protein